MPWRLILCVIIFAVFLAFITVNLEYRCDVNIGFTKFESVPIFLTVFVSFFLGFICALPLALRSRIKNKEIPQKEKNQTADSSPVYSGTDEKIKQDAALARERFFAKRRSGKK